MTKRKVTARAAVGNKTKDAVDEAVKVRRKLMKEKEPQVPKDFFRTVANRVAFDPSRNMALLVLSEPFPKLEKSVLKDRKLAIAFAALYSALDGDDGVIQQYQSLVDFLRTAQLRLMLMLAGRRDMEEVLEAGKKGTLSAKDLHDEAKRLGYPVGEWYVPESMRDVTKKAGKGVRHG